MPSLEFKVELPSVITFCDSDFTQEESFATELLLSASSNKNHFKNKPSIPSETLLVANKPHHQSDKGGGVVREDIRSVFINSFFDGIKGSKAAEQDVSSKELNPDIFDAMLQRDHLSIFHIIEKDARQLGRQDAAGLLDVPAQSIPLLVAINLGLPTQLIKLMVAKTPRRCIGAVNAAGATALSLAILRRMPREVVEELVALSPPEVFAAARASSPLAQEDTILVLAILCKLDAELVERIVERMSGRDVGHLLPLAVDHRLPLPLLGAMIRRAPVDSVRLTVRALMHKNNVSPEYMCALVEADLPLTGSTRPGQSSPAQGYSSWHLLLAHPGDANFEAIRLLLRRNAGVVAQLAVSEDADGRISFGMASKRVRDEMGKYL